MWTHVSGVTTLGQGASLLAYYLSEQDVGTKNIRGYHDVCIAINGMVLERNNSVYRLLEFYTWANNYV